MLVWQSYHLIHYNKDVQRATHICTTLKNRIIEYTINIDKGVNDVAIRSRAKKPETDDARKERQMKETATQLALDNDEKIQKDIDDLKKLRNDMIDDGKILLLEANRLIAIDVVFESNSSDFEICYNELEALRVKLLPHINGNEDCRSTYVTVLGISSDIYDIGYNSRFKWASLLGFTMIDGSSSRIILIKVSSVAISRSISSLSNGTDNVRLDVLTF
jgi:hypothetical protein